MGAIVAILCLLSAPAYAAGVQATVSATVVENVTISQNEDGTVSTAGQPPLYCTSTATETMCYY